MPKISSLIIGLAITGVIITSLGLYAATAARLYGASYDNESLSAYNQLDALNQQAQDLNHTVSSLSEGGIVNYVSGFFNIGYQALKATASTFGTFTGMVTTAGGQLIGQVPGTVIFVSGVIIIITIYFLFIIISTLLGRDV